jgi:hypothetical protein
MFIEALEGRQMFSITISPPSASIGVDKDTITQNASSQQSGSTSFVDKLSNILKKISDTAQTIEQNVK